MSIFFGWIGIIESHNQFSLISLLIILIEKSSLGMTDMEITRSFRRKSDNDFADLGIGEFNELSFVLLLLLGFYLGNGDWITADGVVSGRKSGVSLDLFVKLREDLV